MSLRWYTTKMIKRLGEERYHQISTDPDGRDGPREGWDWHPVTEALVSHSVVCGFNEITERNALEISRRIATYERNKSPSLARRNPDTRKIERVYLTFEDVWNHVGLSTNASTISLKEFEERHGKLGDPALGVSVFDIFEANYSARAA
ncbi:hypothetical protein [Oricola nitratireducens]|uniref:hypothetical protein n=1 Tax=Oricola nitratireducens TaxID=2775868 RepID=UPI001866D3EF|nr:hypothetical protein [Oricola nitratireducens]